MESKIQRFEKLEAEYKMSQKMIDESLTTRKEMEKELALLKQHCKFITEQYNTIELRYEG